MAGKIFVNDNAGVFVRLIDKSQRPGEPRPRVMSGAFAINSERGFMNTIYFVEDRKDMRRYFGKKNWRTLGKSMYDLDKYLEGRRPAYVVRVGPNKDDADEKYITEVDEKLSAVRIKLDEGNIPNPASPNLVTSEGIAYDEVSGREPVDFNGYFCIFFAKGEGDWGDRIRIVIRQRDSAIDRYSNGDGKRIFSLDVEYRNDAGTYKVVEHYKEVSFNPADVSKSGSIYISNVLADSDYIGVAINAEVDPKKTKLFVLDGSEFEFKLDGGKCTDVHSISNPKEKSDLFVDGLKQIFENYIETDPWLAFNAGQEIINSDFNALFGDPLENPNVTNRCLGLTSVLEADSFKIPKNAGGITSQWVAKWFQWLEGYDYDTEMHVMTSPIGWVGKIIAEQDIAGEGMKAPAGYRRGIIDGVTGISKNIKAADRVKVVEYKWNPIKKDPTEYVLWDALTSQPLDSSFSNIHVSLAFQRIRREIEDILKDFTFEDNDESTVNMMLGLLRNAADVYRTQGYAEDIVVDASENRYGTDQIRINWHVTFKEAARTIIVDVIAYRSDQPLSVSMRE